VRHDLLRIKAGLARAQGKRLGRDDIDPAVRAPEPVF
jgi:hypothetical protein